MLIKTTQLFIVLTFINLLVNCSPILDKNLNEKNHYELENRKGNPNIVQQQESFSEESTTYKNEPIKESSVKGGTKETTKKINKESNDLTKDRDSNKNSINDSNRESTNEESNDKTISDNQTEQTNTSEDSNDKNSENEVSEENVKPQCPNSISNENCENNLHHTSYQTSHHTSHHKNSHAILVSGKLLAAAASAKLASPVLINSAKVATYFSLLPIKLAAKGAVLGTVIAKPFVITSAITGAKAYKIAYFFVGKPIAAAAKVLAGAEAIRESLVG